MRQHMNNAGLMILMSDIDRMEHQSPALAMFLGAKIKRFKDQNFLRINSLRKGYNELVDKYVVKDDKGQPQVDGQKFKFESEEVEKEYETAYRELMDKQFDLEV